MNCIHTTRSTRCTHDKVINTNFVRDKMLK